MRIAGLALLAFLVVLVLTLGWLMRPRKGLAPHRPQAESPRQQPPTAPPLTPPALPPQPDRKGVLPKPISSLGRISLTAEFAIVGSRLQVAYSVENHRDREIAVRDVYRTKDPPYFALKSPQVRCEPPETAVLACRWKYVPPNPGISWMHPPEFLATLVAPGEKYSNTMRLPLPLVAEGVGSITVCTQACFEVAVFLDYPQVERLDVSGKSLGRLLVGQVEQVLRSEPHAISIPMVFSNRHRE